jgi:hypothetical protein
MIMNYTITSEKMPSYNADGKTIAALVATCSTTGRVLAVCRKRPFETAARHLVRFKGSIGE